MENMESLIDHTNLIVTFILTLFVHEQWMYVAVYINNNNVNRLHWTNIETMNSKIILLLLYHDLFHDLKDDIDLLFS